MGASVSEARIELTAVDKTAAAFNSAGASVERLKNNLGELGRVFGGLAVFGTVSVAMKNMVDAATEAERASNRLEGVLRATGYAAGISKRELDKMADAMARTTEFDDESLRSAQATLLKFGNITGTVFRDAMKVSADLAAFMGTNVPEAAQLVGKALQSPTEGLKGFAQQFGKLTDAESKAVAELARAGKTIETQNLILEIARSRIGGLAETMNTGLYGASRSLSKEWHELMETMGRADEIGGRAERKMRLLGASLGFLRTELEGVRTPLSRSLGVMLEVMAEWKIPAAAAGLARFREVFPQGGGGGAPMSEDERRRRWEDEFKAQQSAWRAAPKLGGSTPERKGLTAYEQRVLTLQQQIAGAETGKNEFTETQLDILAGKYGVLNEAQERRLLQLAAESERAKGLAEFMKRAGEEALELARETNEADKRKIEALTQQREHYIDLIDPIQKFKRELEIIKRLEQAGSAGGGLTRGEATAARMDVYNRMAEGASLVSDKTKEIDDIARQLGMTFESAFEDAIVSGKGLRGVLQGIGADIARIITRKTITGPLGSALSGWVESWSKPNLHTPWLGAPEYAAGGGIMTASGPLRLGRYAGGGIADSPQLAIFGEGSRPEAYVPLPDGRRIPVQMKGGGSAGVINHFTVDMRGASVEAVMQLRRLVMEVNGSIEGRAVSAVVDASRRRGRSIF